jgi:hypothetical protein
MSHAVASDLGLTPAATTTTPPPTPSTPPTLSLPAIATATAAAAAASHCSQVCTRVFSDTPLDEMSKIVIIYRTQHDSLVKRTFQVQVPQFTVGL